MKHYLLLGLSILPFISNAQKFQFGLNAGGVVNSRSVSGGVKNYKYSLPINYTFSIQGSFLLKNNWSIGAEINCTKLSEAYKAQYTSGGLTPKTTMLMANPAYTINAIFTKGFSLKKSEPFINFNIGAGAYSNKDLRYDATESHWEVGAYSKNGIAFNIGFTAGYAYNLTPKISLNTALGARFYNLRAHGMLDKNLSIYAFPLTVGAGVKI